MFILPPNCIVPSATSLTMRPVFPSFLYFISHTPCGRSRRQQIDTFESTWPGQNWALAECGVDPVWWTPLKLIFEVSDAPLPNRLSAGVPATDGRSGAIWTHARRAGARVRADRTVDFHLGEASRAGCRQAH